MKSESVYMFMYMIFKKTQFFQAFFRFCEKNNQKINYFLFIEYLTLSFYILNNLQKLVNQPIFPVLTYIIMSKTMIIKLNNNKNLYHLKISNNLIKCKNTNFSFSNLLFKILCEKNIINGLWSRAEVFNLEGVPPPREA